MNKVNKMMVKVHLTQFEQFNIKLNCTTSGDLRSWHICVMCYSRDTKNTSHPSLSLIGCF